MRGSHGDERHERSERAESPGLFFLARIADIHPKQQPASCELFLDNCGVVLMDQPAECRADQSPATDCNDGRQAAADASHHEEPDRGKAGAGKYSALSREVREKKVSRGTFGSSSTSFTC